MFFFVLRPCINSAGFFYLVKIMLKFYIIVFYSKCIYIFASSNNNN